MYDTTRQSLITDIRCATSSLDATLDYIATPAVLQWRLLTTIGPDLYTEYCNNARFRWVLDSPHVLEMLLCSGDVEDWDGVMSTLIALIEENGTDLNLPIAISIALSTPLRSFAVKTHSISPLQRYTSFIRWLRDGELFPLTLHGWHWRYIVNSWAEDAELEWARENVLPEFKTAAKIGKATHRMMSYKPHNAEGVSVHEGGAYYKNEPVTLQRMIEGGGVCGAVSRCGVSIAQAHGVPALPVGQPGHAAFLWYKEGQWVLGNNNQGWEKSHVNRVKWSWRREACYIVLMEAAQAQFDQFSLSERLRAVAEISQDKSLQFELLEHATTVCPYNFSAWKDLIACLDHVKELNISSVDLTITLPNHRTVNLTSQNNTLEDMRYILIRKVKQLLLPAHVLVTTHIVEMVRGAGHEPISCNKLCSVSECSERAGNLTNSNGAGAAWWCEGTSAWVEVDLLHLYTVSEVRVQWWGLSVSRRYKVLAGDGGPLEEVRRERDAELSPGEEEYNAWSVVPGWDKVSRVLRLELEEGRLDPWGKGKYFGIRQLIVIGKRHLCPELCWPKSNIF